MEERSNETPVNVSQENIFNEKDKINFKVQACAMLNSFYKKFIDAIRSLPIEDQACNNALHYFDCGLLWASQGIQLAEIKLTPVEQKNEEQVIDANTDQSPEGASTLQ